MYSKGSYHRTFRTYPVHSACGDTSSSALSSVQTQRTRLVTSPPC
uniref:Uncharacterized protein n=1 Tax=Anguilla anguilla TaxID=7936 RepID=A0A0E9V9K1_ANGAN